MIVFIVSLLGLVSTVLILIACWPSNDTDVIRRIMCPFTFKGEDFICHGVGYGITGVRITFKKITKRRFLPNTSETIKVNLSPLLIEQDMTETLTTIRGCMLSSGGILITKGGISTFMEKGNIYLDGDNIILTTAHATAILKYINSVFELVDIVEGNLQSLTKVNDDVSLGLCSDDRFSKLTIFPILNQYKTTYRNKVTRPNINTENRRAIDPETGKFLVKLFNYNDMVHVVFPSHSTKHTYLLSVNSDGEIKAKPSIQVEYAELGKSTIYYINGDLIIDSPSLQHPVVTFKSVVSNPNTCNVKFYSSNDDIVYVYLSGHPVSTNGTTWVDDELIRYRSVDGFVWQRLTN